MQWMQGRDMGRAKGCSGCKEETWDELKDAVDETWDELKDAVDARKRHGTS